MFTSIKSTNKISMYKISKGNNPDMELIAFVLISDFPYRKAGIFFSLRVRVSNTKEAHAPSCLQVLSPFVK